MANIQFINRIKEQQWLQESYKKAFIQGQLLIVYGKRRVGKTELVKHVFQDKPFIYFVAEKAIAKDQLQTAKNIIAEGLHDDGMKAITFPSWRELFRYVGTKLENKTEPTVLVFDEYPYLVQSDERGMSSYFQVGWDEYLKQHKVVLILMGSSISMMYKHALIKSAPLYGRRTGQWLLEPFSFQETKKFYPNASFADVFPLYAVSGGIPAYARVFDGAKNLEENIKKYILPEGSFLSVEPELLLSEDFTDPRSYLSILKAIGLGRTKFSEIVSATGLPVTAVPGYLQTLIALRLVKKEVSVTEPIPEKSKKGNYSLADNFLRFYFSFIYPNNSLIKGGSIDSLFQQHGEILTHIIAKSYEETTTEFITQAFKDGFLPHFEQKGRWWDKDTEIDLVGLNEQDNSILLVETKWNIKPIGIDVLNALKKKSKFVRWGCKGRKEYYALVAKGGFTKELQEQAKKENILLIKEDKVISLE